MTFIWGLKLSLFCCTQPKRTGFKNELSSVYGLFEVLNLAFWLHSTKKVRFQKKKKSSAPYTVYSRFETWPFLLHSTRKAKFQKWVELSMRFNQGLKPGRVVALNQRGKVSKISWAQYRVYPRFETWPFCYTQPKRLGFKNELSSVYVFVDFWNLACMLHSVKKARCQKRVERSIQFILCLTPGFFAALN